MMKFQGFFFSIENLFKRCKKVENLKYSLWVFIDLLFFFFWKNCFSAGISSLGSLLSEWSKASAEKLSSGWPGKLCNYNSFGKCSKCGSCSCRTGYVKTLSGSIDTLISKCMNLSWCSSSRVYDIKLVEMTSLTMCLIGQISAV